MSLRRDDKFGLEHFEHPEDPGNGVLGRVIVIVAIVALVSLAVTIVRRHYANRQADRAASATTPAATSPVASLPTPLPAKSAQDANSEALGAPDGGGAIDLTRRSPDVRKLLMRLNEAERIRDAEMAVSTIEQIRGLPGMPAADIDDRLARRLGALNMQRLFNPAKNAQWVKRVKVKRNHSASRIAAENGSTLASLERLNGVDVGAIATGRDIMVMNHPRFSVVVHRRLCIADLSLNGKFFKRYDIIGEVTGEDGCHATSGSLDAFWRKIGVTFSADNRSELRMLLPNGVPVIVSEI